MGGYGGIKSLTLAQYSGASLYERKITWDSSLYPLTYNCDFPKGGGGGVVYALNSQDNDCSMGYTFTRCEVATFPIRFGKLSPPLFCYFSSSAVVPWLGMQRQCGSPCSLFSCQSPLCTKMLIGPNPPLEAVLVAWPRTLKDTLVWNTKEPIQVPDKEAQSIPTQFNFPAERRGNSRVWGVQCLDGDGGASSSDNKWAPQSSGCCDLLPHNHVLASTSRDSHSPTRLGNANCFTHIHACMNTCTHTHAHLYNEKHATLSK